MTGSVSQSPPIIVENNALGCTGSLNPYCVGKNDLLTTGGGGPGPVAGGVGAAGVLATDGDKEGESQPNVGKDLTTEEKKGLGGTGSSGRNTPKNDDEWSKLESTGSDDKKTR